MRTSSGAYCNPGLDLLMPERTCLDGLVTIRSWRASPSYPVQNKRLLAECDFNGAALFDAFLDPRGIWTSIILGTQTLCSAL